MNGLGLKYWANDSGRNVMPGLLMMLGVVLMVVMQFFPTRFSIVVYAIGICLIATGLITAVTRHLMRRRRFRDDARDEG